jgi:hypothetical protein
LEQRDKVRRSVPHAVFGGTAVRLQAFAVSQGGGDLA